MRAPRPCRPLLACSLALAAACSGGAPPRGEPLPPAAPELRIEGLGTGPIVFRQAELEALGPEDLAWAHHATTDTYRGVWIDKVLARAGLDAGQGGPGVAADDKHLGWRRVVVVEAVDGFTAVFSSAELLAEVGATRAFVAWRKNGVALPVDEAPLRLLVTTDKKGSRSVRRLVSLCVEPPRTRASR